ncbi:hypothetical protein YYC_03894 [Plasmodium yoelii 17X]|uniref:Uncharacterized protein n=1 Tax=Plasmodium yoelii 17X TaxID=1323249 RepID=V7PHP0_PLAYE|nr:hypothetical protein YYC_03894 [Plasmodium yoelii 17X]
MDTDVCQTLIPLRNAFSYVEEDRSYQFTSVEDFKYYCTDGKCDDDTAKINARCLYIFNTLFKDKTEFENVAKGNINIVQYILIWLSYVLSLIKSNKDDNRTFFYNTYIVGNDKYTNNNIEYIVGYKGYKDLIDNNNYILSMDMRIISKLYDAFSTLCEIYIEFDKKTSNCEKCSEKANQFVETYKKIIIDHNIGENVRYFHVLINLLTDYDNLKKKCTNLPSTPDIKKIISEATSNSITSKLIPILSILVAIPIFLGIAYKYNSYKDLLDDKKIVNFDINNMSKFYDAFKSLCTMYYEFNGDNKKCKKYLDDDSDDNEFFKKYKELNKDSNISENSLYKQILSTLSTDYDNFKNLCKEAKSSNIPSLSQIATDISALSSEDTPSSSSITTRLFTVLSIFGAIGFLLGISYKVYNKEFKNYFH